MADEALRPDAGETKDGVVQGAATSAASDAPDTPTPKRRATRRKKADDAETPAPAEAESLAEAAPAEAKPRRTRRKKTDAEAAPEADAEAAAPETSAESSTESSAGAEPAPAEASAEAKPRRTRRKKVDAELAPELAPEAAAPEAPAAPPAEEPSAAERAPESTPAEEKPRRRRTRRAEAPVASSDDPGLEAEASAPASEQASAPASVSQAPAETARAPREGRPAPREERPPQREERYAEEGGSRKSRRNRRKKDRGESGGQPQPPPGEPFEGILELIGDKKFGFIRAFQTSLQKGDNDPFMPPPLIQKYGLRDGVHLKGLIGRGRKGAWQVTEVHEVMGGPPEAWSDVPDFDSGLVIYPDQKLTLPTGPEDVSMRVVDLVAPLGKGQRALIVAPPRAGKTILLKQIAAGLSQNHPEVKLVALLIDERPEEVTDFRRNTAATVFASSNDYGEDNHVRVATLAFEYSRRLVEQGHDVVILLDSLTRLGRTFNLFGGNSGRTMSGGLDARALLMPRKIFGSARNIENGGSLTIIATALVETNSRMDEVIFEEFKGTGNAEIVLDRELSEKRIYPAINIRRSGTRNEERLVPEEHLRQRHLLLRALNSRHPVEAMQALVKQIQLTADNAQLLNELIPESAY